MVKITCEKLQFPESPRRQQRAQTVTEAKAQTSGGLSPSLLIRAQPTLHFTMLPVPHSLVTHSFSCAQKLKKKNRQGSHGGLHNTLAKKGKWKSESIPEKAMSLLAIEASGSNLPIWHHMSKRQAGMTPVTQEGRDIKVYCVWPGTCDLRPVQEQGGSWEPWNGMLPLEGCKVTHHPGRSDVVPLLFSKPGKTHKTCNF